MPIYDYECEKCWAKTEHLVFCERKDSIVCPECGSMAHRVISLPNFVINGFNEKNGYGLREKK